MCGNNGHLHRHYDCGDCEQSLARVVGPGLRRPDRMHDIVGKAVTQLSCRNRTQPVIRQEPDHLPLRDNRLNDGMILINMDMVAPSRRQHGGPLKFRNPHAAPRLLEGCLRNIISREVEPAAFIDVMKVVPNDVHHAIGSPGINRQVLSQCHHLELVTVRKLELSA